MKYSTYLAIAALLAAPLLTPSTAAFAGEELAAPAAVQTPAPAQHKIVKHLQKSHAKRAHSASHSRHAEKRSAA